MELTNKQSEGLKEIIKRYKNNEKYVVISGYAGTGKAQPNDTIIPTPQGYKKIGDLKIGDEVFNRLGKPTKVIGIYPQGQKEVYKVTLKDGRFTLCNDEHIFTVYTSRGNFINKTVRQMIDSGLQNAARQWKFKVPSNGAVEYQEQNYDIDPYVIGSFLGDGCCKERQLTFSSETEENVKELARLIGTDYKKQNDKNFSWTFPLKEVRYTEEYELISGCISKQKIEKEQTKTLFKNYINEMCCGAESKRIPQIYKVGSIKQRYDLIQGLLDTNGSISNKDDGHFSVRFTSISINLIKDLQEVVRSLGYEASIAQDKREGKYSSGVCYSLSINMPNEEKYLMFRLSRKLNIAHEAINYHKKRDYTKIGITNIEDLGYTTEMTCIMVDNDEHLYLTNDFIVTHNTTLVKFAIEALQVNPTKVAYATYTGKAAEVLRKKGNAGACTLHKLLYDHVLMPNGSFLRKPKITLDVSIVVVDEVSMVPKSIIDTLLRHKVFVIFLGDPFQLPQIDKDEENHLLEHPHIFLDEIMRQAAESEIIQLTMKIRHGEKIDFFKGSEVQVLPKKEVHQGVYLWADQILVARNETRQLVNNQMRMLLGYEGIPQDGEKIICLRNYWDDCNEDGDALVNGTTGIIRNSFESFRRVPHYIKMENHDLQSIVCDFIPDGGSIFSGIEMDKKLIMTGEKCITDWKISYQLGKLKSKIGDIIPKEFAFGYAITCHKAQGSEWSKVLTIEENFPKPREEHARWLYTACTRASDRLVLQRED